MSEIDIYQPPTGGGLSLGEKLQLANTYAQAGLIPKAFKGSAADIVIAIEYGEMVNIHPLAAMNLIHVIEGKPTMSAELMRSQVARAGHKFRVLKHSPTEATVMIVRCDDPDYPVEVTWTIEDAERAGLRDVWWERWYQENGRNTKDMWIAPDGLPIPPSADDLKKAGAPEWVAKLGDSKMKRKDNWWNYPQSMLLARATSDAVRAVCPEVLMGVSYTPEELGASVDADGNVLEVAEVPTLPPPAELQALIDRFEKLPEHLQVGMMTKLSTDAHCEVSVPLAKYPEPWWVPIGQLLDYGERKAAEHAAEASAESAPQDVAADGPTREGGIEDVPSAATPTPPAEPVEVLEVAEVPDVFDDLAAEIEAQASARAEGRGGDSVPRDPAPGDAEPPSSDGEAVPPAASPSRPPAEPREPMAVATRSKLFALYNKVVAVPAAVGSDNQAREEYRRTVLLEQIIPAVGGPVLGSRTEIWQDLALRLVAVFEGMERGDVELMADAEGLPILVDTRTGERAA